MVGIDGVVVSAVGLGVAYAAAPGVVNAEALRRGVAGGFRPALLVQLGSLAGDAVWAVVALTGAAVLVEHEAVGIALGLVGAGFLLRLARTALVGAVTGRTADGGAVPAKTGGDFAVGAIFGLANPAGLAFWAGLGGGVLASTDGGSAVGRAAIFLAGFLVGALLWGSGLAALVGWGRRFAGPRFFRVVDAVVGVALGVFGVRLLWAALRRLGRWLPWRWAGLAWA